MLTGLTHRRLVDARDRLCVDLESAPSVGDVARQLGTSPAELVRRFAAVFGETPHRYRTRLRLERARRMLVLDRVSVTDVCMAAGFTSLGSFSTLYARHFGEPPSACRRRLFSAGPALGSLSAELMPGCLTLMTAAWASRRNFREASVPGVGDTSVSSVRQGSPP